MAVIVILFFIGCFTVQLQQQTGINYNLTVLLEVMYGILNLYKIAKNVCDTKKPGLKRM